MIGADCSAMWCSSLLVAVLLSVSKSIRITTRRGVGRLTSSNPAAANMLRVPTWSSPQVMSSPGWVSIG